MTGSAKRFRDLQRILHLVAAVLLGTYLYSPLLDAETFAAVVRIGAFPILVLSGSGMWHQARLRRWLRRDAATGQLSR